jgi:hypothetical protein
MNISVEVREQYFRDLLSKEPYSYKDIYYQDKMQRLPVYRIEVNYLRFNPYNGRIASHVKSYEMEHGVTIDTADSKYEDLLAGFLEAAHKQKNKDTYESIRDHGQKEYGIVTRDGIIIDGNRRAMLLKKRAIEKHEPGYFMGVVLDQNLADNRKEIMLLETSYQMGEDAKADYNPIEKYLKCRDMHEIGLTQSEIAKAMGQHEATVKEYLEIMDIMEEYLVNLGYNGIYTRLDKTEDLFINLNKVQRRWKTSGGKIQWSVQDSDLSDHKLICFDYIRYVYNANKGIESKDVRDLLFKNTENSLIANQKIWTEFVTQHEQTVWDKPDIERSVDELRATNPNADLSLILQHRDEWWAEQVNAPIKQNYHKSKRALEDYHDVNEPSKLLSAALDKVRAINIDSQTFLNSQEAYKLVDEIRKWADDAKKYWQDRNKRKP